MPRMNATVGIADDLALVETEHRDKVAKTARYKCWRDAFQLLYTRKEAAPWGATATEWAKHIAAYLGAASQLEALADHKDPSLDIRGNTLFPHTRLLEVANAGLSEDFRAEYRIAAKVVLAAIQKPRTLKSLLGKLLESPKLETIRLMMESLVESALYVAPPEKPSATVTPAPTKVVPAAEFDRTGYDGPLPPKEWHRKFRMSPTKFRNLRKSGEILVHALSTKSLYVHETSVFKYENVAPK